MSEKNEAFKNWEEWAKNDWKEFRTFFIAKYNKVHFSEIEKVFANEMKISHQAFAIMTDIAAGKVVEKAATATLGSILSFAEIISAIAGYGYWGFSRNTFHNRVNPHIPDEDDFDQPWYWRTDLPNYVKYILYCYPKDLDEGWYGFRYGVHKGELEPRLLRKTKNL